MNIVLLLLSFAWCSYTNYVAYIHIRRYKYYKQVTRVPFEQGIVGVFIGLPYVFMPFVVTEKERGFLKYNIINNAIFLARISFVPLITIITFIILNFLFLKWI